MNRKAHAARRNGGNPEVSLEDVERNLDALKHDLSELSSTVQALASEQKDSAIAAGAAHLEALGERGKASAGRAEERLDHALDEAGRTLRERPLATVAIAAAVGLAVGYLSGSRR